MKKIKRFIYNRKVVRYYRKGKAYLNNPEYLKTQQESKKEILKEPSRTTIINYLLSLKKEDTTYLEIGVRNPEHNYNHINANTKYSVDPGIEFKKNPVDFKMTSDTFFNKLLKSEILSNTIKFDVIFIDGLHLAEQVDRDIENALKYIKDDGFIVLHDCNPPTEWHAREHFEYKDTPAGGYWNGTTWKAFLKWRGNPSVHSCCVDSDWGVGIISKHHPIGKSITNVNPFYEYKILEKQRREHLNLIDFESLKQLL